MSAHSMRPVVRQKSGVPHYPIRVKSARGEPEPVTQIERTCKTCGAAFLGLSPSKTGEQGLWGGPTGWTWWCSRECAGGRS